MHIGIDASRANREQKTGIEWYAYHLLNAMKPKSDQLDRFLLYTNTPLHDELATCPSHWEERVLHWLPRRLWTHGRLSLEMLFNAPDLLFIPSHVIPIVCGRRVVMTCHDIGFERHAHLYPRWERAYHRMMMRHALKRATHFIAVSEFTKKEMIDVYGISSDRISVIHHGYYGGLKNYELGIRNAELAPTTIHHSAFNIPNSYFLFVGRIEAKKNVTCVIDAFSQLHAAKSIPADMRLVLVGKPGFQSDAIFSYIRASAYSHLIDYNGWVPSEQLQALYANATLYLFPSLYEGFGFPLLEAMAASVPVIASDIPSLREVGGAAAEYATPNAEAFAEAVQSLLVDIVRMDELKAAGRERIKQFSWEKAVEQTLTVLHNAVS